MTGLDMVRLGLGTGCGERADVVVKFRAHKHETATAAGYADAATAGEGPQVTNGNREIQGGFLKVHVNRWIGTKSGEVGRGLGEFARHETKVVEVEK